MLNFSQQQDPGMFPAISGLEQRVHPITKYMLGAVGGVGGYFWGISQTILPVALCIGLGIVVGLLLVPLLLGGVSLLVGVVLVALAALAAFWLLGNDAALKHPASAPVQQIQPAEPLPDVRLYRF